jgi:hypothetical protein
MMENTRNNEIGWIGWNRKHRGRNRKHCGCKIQAIVGMKMENIECNRDRARNIVDGNT